MNVNSWWVNLIWELVLHLFLQPLFFLVWAKRNKCFILIVQVPCLVWIVKPVLWGHAFGCTNQSFPLHIRRLKYLVSFYLASVLYLRFVKNDYYVKEEKQDGLFQLTGHEIVISLNSTRSVNGTSMTHFSGAHRHFCNQCSNGRVGWGWKEMGWHPTVFSQNLSSCLYNGLLKRTMCLLTYHATYFFLIALSVCAKIIQHIKCNKCSY